MSSWEPLVGVALGGVLTGGVSLWLGARAHARALELAAIASRERLGAELREQRREAYLTIAKFVQRTRRAMWASLEEIPAPATQEERDDVWALATVYGSPAVEAAVDELFVALTRASTARMDADEARKAVGASPHDLKERIAAIENGRATTKALGESCSTLLSLMKTELNALAATLS